MDPLAAKLLGARLPHGEALSIRLDFVGFVVSKSPLELTFGHVDRLWRDFLTGPLCGAVKRRMGFFFFFSCASWLTSHVVTFS